jgi:hypothetical protein
VDDGRLAAWLSRAFVVVAIGAATVLALAHLDDRFQIDPAMGTRLVLAQDSSRGVLYPPIYQAGYFAGTRYMPIPFVVLGWAGTLIRNAVVAEKVLGIATFALLMIVTYRVLRSLGCSPVVALLLPSSLLLSQVGVHQVAAFGGDVPATALQLAAVSLIASSPSERSTRASGVLAAIALFCKSSALWAPLAIVLWLWSRDRASVKRWVVWFLASSVLLFVLFEAASGGRFVENVVGLSFGGERNWQNLVRPLLFFLMLPYNLILFALLPPAIVGSFLARRRGTWTIYHTGFWCAAAILVVVLTDSGAASNHLIDLMVLAAILTGHLRTTVFEDREDPRRGRTTVIGFCVAALALGAVNETPYLTSTIRAWRAPRQPARFALDPLDGVVRPTDRILSEDPTIPFLLGERPVVMDPFMFLTISADRPSWDRELVGRIERHEFDRVILQHRAGPSWARWYRYFDFGTPIADAIRREYTQIAVVGGFHVYAPNGAPSSATS